jgi:hypothetical protein
MLSLLTFFLIILVIGYLFTHRFLIVSTAGWPMFIFQCTLGVGFGFGITSGVTFLILFIYGPSPWFIFTADMAILLCLSALCVTNSKAQKTSHFNKLAFIQFKQKEISYLLLFNFSIVLILSVFLFVLLTTLFPHGYWDAWSIWNLRARYLFRGDNNWTAVFSNLVSHAEYPHLVSASVFRGWTYCGKETLLVPVLFAALFTYATPGLLLSSLILVRSIFQGVIASLLLLGMPYFIGQGVAQYADIPLSFFILATFILFYFQDRYGKYQQQFIVFAGLTSGLACWTKNEGILFLVSVFTSRFVVCAALKGWKENFKQIVFFLFGLSPLLILLIYFKLQAPFNDIVYGSYNKMINTFLQLIDSSRYSHILSQFIEKGLSFQEFIITPFPILLAYLILLGAKIENSDKAFFLFAATSLSMMLIGYFFTYVITPRDLDWHLRTSLNRLLLHLWPAFLFVFFLITRTPEQYLYKKNIR